MSRLLRLVPPDAPPLAALARALALAVGDATDWVPVSLDDLQALGAPAPCEVESLLAEVGGESALREWTARRVVWRYARRRAGGGPACFLVRPWQGLGPGDVPPLPQDIHRHPPARAPLDRAVRRLRIAEAVERRQKSDTRPDGRPGPRTFGVTRTGSPDTPPASAGGPGNLGATLTAGRAESAPCPSREAADRRRGKAAP